MGRNITTAGFLFAACVTVVAPEVGDEFGLRVGQSATAVEYDVTVKFDGISNDSRCARQVQCVWAGDAGVVIEMTLSDGEVLIDTLHTNEGKKSVVVDGVTLELVGLEPYPETTEAIELKEYVARFVFSA